MIRRALRLIPEFCLVVAFFAAAWWAVLIITAILAPVGAWVS